MQKHKTHGKLPPNIRIISHHVYKALHNWSLSLQFHVEPVSPAYYALAPLAISGVLK